jgi:hypothetical protein
MNLRNKRSPREAAAPTTAISEADDSLLAGATAYQLNRRSFLVRGGVTAATAGIMASVPGSALLGAFEADAPAVDNEVAPATDAEVANMTDPVIAHVKDLSTGEISIYSGEQEVVLRNPGLAAQLFRASNR